MSNTSYKVSDYMLSGYTFSAAILSSKPTESLNENGMFSISGTSDSLNFYYVTYGAYIKYVDAQVNLLDTDFVRDKTSGYKGVYEYTKTFSGYTF